MTRVALCMYTLARSRSDYDVWEKKLLFVNLFKVLEQAEVYGGILLLLVQEPASEVRFITLQRGRKPASHR